MIIARKWSRWVFARGGANCELIDQSFTQTIRVYNLIHYYYIFVKDNQILKFSFGLASTEKKERGEYYHIQRFVGSFYHEHETYTVSQLKEICLWIFWGRKSFQVVLDHVNQIIQIWCRVSLILNEVGTVRFDSDFGFEPTV